MFNIFIKDLNRGTTSDINGYYNLTGVKNGKYEVTISYIGYKSISKFISFNDKTILFDTTLVVDGVNLEQVVVCLLYTSPSPRDRTRSRMPSSA